MSLEYKKENITLAKELRKNQTEEEKKLWFYFLRTFPVRFQRQKAIDSYIVDFYCSKAKLAVELDGAQHFTPEEKKKDKQRTEILNRYGIRVLRFTNEEINRKFEEVCAVITAEVKKGTGSFGI